MPARYRVAVAVLVRFGLGAMDDAPSSCALACAHEAGILLGAIASVAAFRRKTRAQTGLQLALGAWLADVAYVYGFVVDEHHTTLPDAIRDGTRCPSSGALHVLDRHGTGAAAVATVVAIYAAARLAVRAEEPSL